MDKLITDEANYKLIDDDNSIGVYKNRDYSIIKFNNNLEISYRDVVVCYQAVGILLASTLSIISSVKTAKLTKGKSCRVILEETGIKILCRSRRYKSYNFTNILFRCRCKWQDICKRIKKF